MTVRVRSGLERLLALLAAIDWRRETLYPLSAAMEVAWFAPWYLALIPATGRLPPLRTAIGLLVIMVIPVYTARLLDRLSLKPRVQQAAMVALLALSCILALRVLLYAGQAYKGLDWLAETITEVISFNALIPDWFVIVMSTLFLWWRGISLGQRRPSVDAVAFGFYVGIVSFIGFVLVVSIVTGQDPAFFIPIFFFFSLMALAATRMEEMRGLRGAIRSPFGFSWLFAITLAALAVIILGALLGALLTGGDMQAVLHWIEPLLLVAGILLGLALVALRTVVHWLLGLLRGLGLGGVSAPLAELLDGLDDLLPDPAAGQIEAPAGLSTVAGIIRLLFFFALVVGMGVLVIWMVRRQSRLPREREDEDHEFLLSPALLAENLRRWAEAGRGRLATLLGVVENAGLRGLFRALTIRRIYAHMLHLGAEQGYPRAAHQTPYEYQETAARAFPAALAEVYVITEAYIAVHYGEAPETGAELQEIRACWERLKESVHVKSDGP